MKQPLSVRRESAFLICRSIIALLSALAKLTAVYGQIRRFISHLLWVLHKNAVSEIVFFVIRNIDKHTFIYYNKYKSICVFLHIISEF